ncbi:MAG: acetyl-CoA carboxylase biotin carboxyl carrier protein subunit, partial [Treponema sp.]|nr:acetyl-CoA carboxylase biotin carboxyl carrier protein subunit [Treponema sp.]
MNEKFILNVIEKFNAASIAELDLDDGTSHLILRKEGAFAKNAAAGSPAPPPAPITASTGAALPPPPETASPVHLGLPVSSSGNETITSPIVATFYGAPGPDAPAFVKAGSTVKAGDSLCILEAMKMMNHLEAE